MKTYSIAFYVTFLSALILGGINCQSHRQQLDSSILFGNTGRLTRNSSIAVTTSPNRSVLSVLFDSLTLRLEPEEHLKSVSYTLDLDLMQAGSTPALLKTDIRYFIDMDSCVSLICQIRVDTSRYGFIFPFDMPASRADSLFSFVHRPLHPERGKLTFDFDVIIKRRKNVPECNSEALFAMDTWDITTKQ